MSGRQLIRYGYRAALSNPYARAGYTAYRYGPTAARAAGTIARWAFKQVVKRRKRAKSTGMRAKKKARFSKTKVGETVGTDNAKRRLIQDNDMTARDTRTLYSINVCAIPFGDEIDQRQRNIVNIRGFKICKEIQCNNTSPLYYNMALLSGKVDQAAPDGTDFFRQSATERGGNFSINLNSNEMHCLPINTDKYTILFHKRYRLNGTGANQRSYKGSNYMNISKYVKLKRQIRFDKSADGLPTSGNVYLVEWADLWGAASGSAVQVGQWSKSDRIITYYRTSCAC